MSENINPDCHLISCLHGQQRLMVLKLMISIYVTVTLDSVATTTTTTKTVFLPFKLNWQKLEIIKSKVHGCPK